MYKYKKVIAPILMVVLTISFIVAIIAIIFLHLTNVNTLKSKITDIKYYDKVEINITNSLKNYMTEQDISSLLDNSKVKKDVDKLIGSMKSNMLLEEESFLKAEFEENLLKLINANDLTTNNINVYTQKISNVYFSNLFPTNELDTIQNITLKIQDSSIYVLIISIIFLLLCVIYLLNAGKQKKWLFVSIYNGIVFCLVLIVILSNFTDIYYSNNAVTDLLTAFIVSGIWNIVLVEILLLITVIILNYIEYFKKR